MNKKTKLAIAISAIAAVISAVVLVIVFWDKLLERFSPKADEGWEEDLEPKEPTPAYNEEEIQDFADLEQSSC